MLAPRTPRLVQLVVAGMALGQAWITVACNEAGAGADKPAATIPVELRTVDARDMPVEVRALGTVEAVSTVEIVSQVTGRVTGVHFEEGAAVKRGDPLFTIDTRPYSASLAAAEAELEKSRALAEQAKSEAGLYEALAREGLASAEASSQKSAMVKSSEAAIHAARAQIASASLNVQFTTIRSPLNGRTGRLLVHAGNVVHANDTGPMVVIRDLSPVKVTFPVPQALLPELRRHMEAGAVAVTATPRAIGAETASGVLSFIDNSVDPTTGMLTLKATFANHGEELWPGSFVDVVLMLDVEKAAVVAPERAILEGQNGAFAFVVDADNVAHQRFVKVRRRTESSAVIETGLTRGERVVVDGLVRLSDGARVSIKPSPSTAATSPASSGSAGPQPPGGAGNAAAPSTDPTSRLP